MAILSSDFLPQNIMKKIFIALCFIIFGCVAQSIPLGPPILVKGGIIDGIYRPSPDIMESLKSLPKLPKPHMIVGGYQASTIKNRELMREFTRITGVMNIHLGHFQSPSITKMQIELFDSIPGCVIALHWSPYIDNPNHIYNNMYDIDDFEGSRCGDPRVDYPEYIKHMEWLKSTLPIAKEVIQDRPVKYITLDYECFERSDDPTINAAIIKRLLEYQHIIKQTFPDPTIIWEQQGEIRLQPTLGWEERPHFPARIYGLLGPFSCSPQCNWDIMSFRESIRRTTNLADQYNVNDVYVIMSLGYTAGIKKTHQEFHSYNFNAGYEYDPQISWRLGAELNDPWYANSPEIIPGKPLIRTPYERVKGVLFEPSPLRSDDVRLRHFIEYVKGANGIE